MLKQLQKRKDESGFTIIEVLIVLAIAGLIMVVVFLAVPNLQRTQRNNARKTDANNLLSNLSEYVGNNAGQTPTAACTGGSGANGCTWAATVANNKLGQYSTGSVQYMTAVPTTAPTKDQAFLISNATCSGVNAVASTNSRNFVVWYGIEQSTGTVCTSGN